MEYRKLIKFGKNSFIVSLPKQWIEHNKLVKGSLIQVQPNGNQLALLATPSEASAVLSETNIDLDKVPLNAVKRLICSAYINNVRVLNITGKSLAQNAAYVRSIIHNMIALEIHEQTPSRIIARDYLNMREISIESLLRKMDNIVRSMYLDIIEAAKKGDPATLKDISEGITLRDVDVNRLTFLALRAIKYQIANPMMIESVHTSEDLVHIWESTENLERVADELKYAAQLLPGVSPSNLPGAASVISQARDVYLAAMKAHYTKDVNSAVLVADHRLSLFAAITDVIDVEKSNRSEIRLSEHLRGLARTIHALNRMTYQRPHARMDTT
ncbi:MAG: phosphate uptake regulator PhoU [Candidatus Woesearchaeota archaeon]